jgi:hypothetical protein
MLMLPSQQVFSSGFGAPRCKTENARHGTAYEREPESATCQIPPAAAAASLSFSSHGTRDHLRLFLWS